MQFGTVGGLGRQVEFDCHFHQVTITELGTTGQILSKGGPIHRKTAQAGGWSGGHDYKWAG